MGLFSGGYVSFREVHWLRAKHVLIILCHRQKRTPRAGPADESAVKTLELETSCKVSTTSKKLKTMQKFSSFHKYSCPPKCQKTTAGVCVCVCDVSQLFQRFPCLYLYIPKKTSYPIPGEKKTHAQHQPKGCPTHRSPYLTSAPC